MAERNKAKGNPLQRAGNAVRETWYDFQDGGGLGAAGRRMATRSMIVSTVAGPVGFVGGESTDPLSYISVDPEMTHAFIGAGILIAAGVGINTVEAVLHTISEGRQRQLAPQLEYASKLRFWQNIERELRKPTLPLRRSLSYEEFRHEDLFGTSSRSRPAPSPS